MLALEPPRGDRLVRSSGVVAHPCCCHRTRSAPSCLGSSAVTAKTLCPEHATPTKKHSCGKVHGCPWAGGCDTQQAGQQRNAMPPHGMACPGESLTSNYTALVATSPLGRQTTDKSWAAGPRLLCGTSSMPPCSVCKEGLRKKILLPLFCLFRLGSGVDQA